jgi:hypothetical protein
VTTLALLNAAVSIPSTLADPCPDIEVVFARGADDPPGVSYFGEAFVDSAWACEADPMAAVNMVAATQVARRNMANRLPIYGGGRGGGTPGTGGFIGSWFFTTPPVKNDCNATQLGIITI